MASAPLDEKVGADVEQNEVVKGLKPSAGDGDIVLLDDAGQIRRIPVPSNDPNDPLNFSKWRKLGVLICCCWFCRTTFLTASKVLH